MICLFWGYEERKPGKGGKDKKEHLYGTVSESFDYLRTDKRFFRYGIPCGAWTKIWCNQKKKNNAFEEETVFMGDSVLCQTFCLGRRAFGLCTSVRTNGKSGRDGLYSSTFQLEV